MGKVGENPDIPVDRLEATRDVQIEWILEIRYHLINFDTQRGNVE